MDFLKKSIHVIIAIGIAALICAGVMIYENDVYQGLFPAIRLWCDGTFISGVFMLGAGGLSFISQNGGFDALRYAFVKLKDRFLHPRPDDMRDEQSYYDYVKQKHSGKKHSVLHILIIGTILVVVSIILAFFCPDVPV